MHNCLNKMKIFRPIFRQFSIGAQNRPIKSPAFWLAKIRIGWVDRRCVRYRGTVVLSGHAGRLRSVGAPCWRSVGIDWLRPCWRSIAGPCRHRMTRYQNGATSGRVTCNGAGFGHCVGLIKAALRSAHCLPGTRRPPGQHQDKIKPAN